MMLKKLIKQDNNQKLLQITLGVSWEATTSKKEGSLAFLAKVTHPPDLSPENSATSSLCI